MNYANSERALLQPDNTRTEDYFDPAYKIDHGKCNRYKAYGSLLKPYARYFDSLLPKTDFPLFIH